MARVRIALVGDPHGAWNTAIDEQALRHLQPNLVLFTGDFGNEDVKLVEDVSKLQMRKAVILGNHDCWWSALSVEKNIRKLHVKVSPTAVSEQIALLGNSHVGFRRLDYQDLHLSVVGSRPFSIGGDQIFGKQHVKSFYDIDTMEASTQKITELALGAPQDHSVIVLGHNGPTGLGSQPHDICGKDFDKNGGDHGDPDLAEALKLLEGKRKIPLVCFGHMHKKLAKDLGDRKMTAVGSNGTVYVNGAVVPRERTSKKSERQFTMIELVNGRVEKVTETWVRVGDRQGSSVVGETVLFPPDEE